MSKQTETEVMDDIELIEYIPRVFDELKRWPRSVIIKNREGKSTKIRARSYHRSDGLKYVSNDDKAWLGEKGTGLVAGPQFIKPQKREKKTGNTVLTAIFDALFSQIDSKQLEGVVGQFNQEPLKEYMGIKAPKACMFRKNAECSFSGKSCPCVVRANQILTWGHSNGVFTPLAEPIRGELIDFYALRDLVKSQAAEWDEFTSKTSKKYSKAEFKGMTADDIGAHKILDIIQTMQRTSLSSINCYGFAYHQFAYAFETSYATDDVVVFARLAVGQRDPQNESKGQARKRIGKVNEKLTAARMKRLKQRKGSTTVEEDEVINMADVEVQNGDESVILKE